ncbi:hypothetical protein PCC7424_5487 (plasmid) [Gloeothece citriformis PCC 7424]|uniref:Uncharacterized protein n=1 Tax=Gloeothece citriformis (strain PCC 7424) TaxID=65393 RepID=B7KMN5_GLOC7|nr:hypothetical protein [Gloeothece citriformis]ACK74057.1 hypothetical protein PCC7424_5487 [Gloeothece citriformis PCC 7424]
MHYFSFLSTVKAFGSGLIEPTSDDKFVFNCRRSRVLNERIPGYVSQMNILQYPVPDNTVLLDPKDLHPSTLEQWNKLREIIDEADRKGNVIWLKNEDGSFVFNEETGDWLTMTDIYLETPPNERFMNKEIL